MAWDRTVDGISRVRDIVISLKEFAHPTMKEKSLSDINRVLTNTLNIARNEYKYHAEVETDLGDLPPIPCHMGELGQVFLNLIVNAAHAISEKVGDSEEKGLIKIATRVQGDGVLISIGDSGCGIPTEIHYRIFDLFFTTKEVGKGSGQGLALAHKVVVEKHGGLIEFESEVGLGTTFHILLPLEDSTPPKGTE